MPPQHDADGVHAARTALTLAKVRASSPLEGQWPNEGTPMPYSRDEIVSAAGEALFWVGVLDQAEEDRLGRLHYHSVRNADPDGLVVRGLLWARNSLAHGAVVVSIGRFEGAGVRVTLNRTGGVHHATTIGVDRHGLAWRRIEHIAITNRDRKQLPMYKEHVADGWVADTLDTAIRWFERVAEETSRDALAVGQRPDQREGRPA